MDQRRLSGGRIKPKLSCQLRLSVSKLVIVWAGFNNPFGAPHSDNHAFYIEVLLNSSDSRAVLEWFETDLQSGFRANLE